MLNNTEGSVIYCLRQIIWSSSLFSKILKTISYKNNNDGQLLTQNNFAALVIINWNSFIVYSNNFIWLDTVTVTVNPLATLNFNIWMTN